MSKADDIIHNLGDALESVGVMHRERSLYEGSGIRIVMRCRTKPEDSTSSSDYMIYSFGITEDYYFLLKSGSRLSSDDVKCSSYVLFACGDAGENLPVALYLIPADFITGDNIKRYQDKKSGDHKFHLKVFDDYGSAELREEDASPMSNLNKYELPALSVEDIMEALLPLMKYEAFFKEKEQREQREIEILEDSDDFRNERQTVPSSRIKRHQAIVNYAKMRYENKCQIENCGSTFVKKNGDFYSEGHHLIPLSEGGLQELSNLVILCPNHHRMFHYANVEIEDIEDEKREVIINGVLHHIVY